MFNFAKLLFKVEISDSTDGYLLFRIKNHFPKAFVDASALTGDRNAVEVVFAQALATDPAALRRFQKPPLPFAFHIPQIPAFKNHEFNCSIVLSIVGSAINHLSTFIVAVKLAVSELSSECSIRMSVTHCFAVTNGGELAEITPEGDGLVLMSGEENIVAINPLKLELMTPLRLIRQGHVIQSLSFSIFACSIMRRVSSLAYYYGGAELDFNYKWLSEISTLARVENANISFGKWPNLGVGILGSLEFNDVHPDLYQFLRMGEEFNLGKNAAFGNGEFRMII
ncbi:hypothetical protein OR1_03237 [Geobacter sp. OR-1]|uniref:CRISPR system precrRNA processing endoribonuclease RAMP protein Cas6 n=1 Tax=Geobacter sp. OR-1 TaxID=1266765 RepID=UPI000541D068|nr:CRISPR system precrRNA processing endoribonuclease RAMP protein Cas6 [Geobacter sp. OR-1]GAM10934.1 hypothetical protein OR1_03237 [Geobacter sp. OR-1]